MTEEEKIMLVTFSLSCATVAAGEVLMGSVDMALGILAYTAAICGIFGLLGALAELCQYLADNE